LQLLFRLLSYLLLFNFSLIPFHFPELNLAQVFSPEPSFVSHAADSKLITLLVTGDVLPGRSVELNLARKGDPTFAFAKVAGTLRNADLTLINLEGPLLSGCPIITTGVTFCGDPRFVRGLTFAGVDVVNIANNHILNFGQGGLDQTRKILRENNLVAVGEEQIGFKKVRGVTFAFLGFDVVGKKIDRSFLTRQIKKARSTADVVVVQFHWGQEYTYVPKTAGENPINLAHFTIRSGADLVVGNHPHWIQGIEFYRGNPIVYSHGNFVFDQMWSQETQEGMVGKYTFYGSKLVNIEFLPIKIDSPFQPRFLEGKEKDKLLQKIHTSSEKISELVK